MIRKTFTITEENYEILKRLEKENAFSSESQTINFLLKRENEDSINKIADAVLEKLEKNYIQKERLKWATQTAEQNSIILLDVMNTILHKENIEDCISVGFAEHEVITQSRAILKERIAYLKQKSDERKALKK